jgi:hypothetical protein
MPLWLTVVLYALIILLLATLVKWEFSRFVRGRRIKTPIDFEGTSR